MPHPPSESPSTNPDHLNNKNFRVVEILRDPDGVIMMITERLSDGRVSFVLGREFDQMVNGQKVTKFTSYLAPRHLGAVQRLVADALEGDLLELQQDRAATKRRGA